MYITGAQSDAELNRECRCDATQPNAIVLDAFCLLAQLNGCGENKLCLRELEIPIENSFKYNVKLSADEIFTLRDCISDFKFVAVWVVDNKIIHYRMLDDLSDNLEVVNYNFELEAVTEDIGCNRVGVTIDVSLTPDNTNYIATWDGIDTIYLDGDPFTKWNEADLSWFGIGSANIGNRLQYPTFTGQITGSLFEDEAGEIISNVITGEVSDPLGAIKYEISLNISYNRNTGVTTYSIDSVALKLNEFLKNPVAVEPGSDSVIKSTVSGENGDYDILTINIDGKFKTISAKRYKTLNSLLVLSSETKLDDIEFYNTLNSDVELCILGAI